MSEGKCETFTREEIAEFIEHMRGKSPILTEAVLDAMTEAISQQERFGISTMNVGGAIRALKDGKRVARAGWNGKGIWLALMPGFVIPTGMVNERTRKFVPEGVDLKCGGYIVMWTAQQVRQPGWLASQADMLAEDWSIVD